jgi:HTH-type transcriptional regulator/antitoxin HigA
MIKSEVQKNRTLKSIYEIKKDIETMNSSKDYDEELKKVYLGSNQSMLGELEREVQEYEDLKAGKFVLPKNITFVELLKNLTKIRISRGLSQQDLGNKIGVSRQKINLYEEHDYQNVKIDKINAILGAFNISLDMKSNVELAA